jgi:hypothetical protein
MICTCRWQGSDGSVMSNYEEVVLPHNTQHGEAPMMRYIMERLAAYFGASWTDALAVHSAVCTELMGGSVNIAEHCSAQGIPLNVRFSSRIIQCYRCVCCLHCQCIVLRSTACVCTASLVVLGVDLCKSVHACTLSQTQPRMVGTSRLLRALLQ